MALTNNPVVLGGGSAEANTSATIVTSGGVVIQQPGEANGLVIYNTADQTTNYEDVRLYWNSNTARLFTENGGSGTLRALQLGNGDNTVLIQPSAASTGGIQLSPFLGNSSTAIGLGVNPSQSTATSGAIVGLSLTPTYNQASGNAANTDLLINRVETAVGSGNQFLIRAQAGTTGGTDKFYITNGGGMLMAGKLNSYNGVSTTGYGTGAIYNSGRITAQSAAATIGTYTIGAADGSFRVSANMNVTASTVLTTTLTCNYTDESNTARSMILPVASLAGTFLTAGAITGAGATVWESAVMHIRCKASTAITILTSTGTFTGVTYTAECSIMQIA